MDKASETITVPGAQGKKVTAAVEDVKITVTDDDLAQAVIES